MKILAIDTSTEACSAALYIDGHSHVQFEIAPQQHSKLILKQCDTLLANAELKPTQLDAIAFGRGPGSFTGLRIAAGVTQGIAYACDLPVIDISTLAAQAQKICVAHPDHIYLSTIDARMKEIYWGVYALSDNQMVELQSDEKVGLASEVSCQQLDRRLIGVGSGWKEYQTELDASLPMNILSDIYPDTLPSAKEIALLASYRLKRGKVLTAEKAIPVYLRNNVAKKSAKSQTL